jgi:hypothetical protein
MTTRSLVRATRQIALPIHLYPASLDLHLAATPGTRAAVIAALARLLLEAAAVSARAEADVEVRDEP